MEGSPKRTRETVRPACRRTCSASQISKRLRHCPDLPRVFCCLLSVVSLGVCILVHYRTSDLQTRVSHLEEERQVYSAWFSMDQMEPAIFNRVDQLLTEKLKAHLPKVRAARGVPGGCMCPPGPPGEKGRHGRRGVPVWPTSVKYWDKDVETNPLPKAAKSWDRGIQFG
ncbi:collagen alpha-1(XXIII) chain-like [Pristis pectinata]|uniref:collagen alpha-1(XXIII) chain-like n=1 Tax=Pristis pectinata TaxID=685728 RepID=UPI00223E1C49|nr:collagen alpha-1(XXIII) chain-like [Pristis pectinata]